MTQEQGQFSFWSERRANDKMTCQFHVMTELYPQRNSVCVAKVFLSILSPQYYRILQLSGHFDFHWSYSDFTSLAYSHSSNLLLLFLVICAFKATEGTLPYSEVDGLTLLEPPSYPSAPSYPIPSSYSSDVLPYPGESSHPSELPSTPSIYPSPPSYPSSPSLRSPPYSSSKCALLVPGSRSAGPVLKPLPAGLQYVNNYISR